MSNKVFEIRINVTSTTWDSAYAYVEAKTEKEAKEMFEANPYNFDWDGWETHDSETRDWEVDSIEYDEFMTNRMKEQNGEEV